MSKRAVVFGSSGQLGVELVRELKERGYVVSEFPRKAIDITDRERVEKALAPIDPSVVFNAAAYNQVDVAEREPQAAFLANALGVRNLAMACRQVDAPLLAAAAIELEQRNCTGVFHAGGGTPISWFEYARLIFDSAGANPELRPTNEREYRTAARRPKYSALSNAKMESEGVAAFPA